jgi:SAM-dependent methyltransferase
LWSSRLAPKILDAAAWQQLDESARGAALKALRTGNFALLLQRLLAVKGTAGGRMLDIGAAHGWFVLQATAAGYQCCGLEPDPRLADHARSHGAAIQQGFFPDALEADESFDVLVFNDVFEHLPDPRAALQACAQHLNVDGLLVLNLPLGSGFFFRLSRWLLQLGIEAPWLRAWQAGFPSPHLFFYQRCHLVQLAESCGLHLVSESALPSMRIKGLWARLRMDQQRSWWAHALVWPLLVVMTPVVSWLPNDIGLFIFRKQ